MDLVFDDYGSYAVPLVSQSKRSGNTITITDKVLEYNYVRGILQGVLKGKNKKLKTDDMILNLSLLNLMLDFGLYAIF